MPTVTKSAYEVGVNLLSRREHTQKELADKLGQRGFALDAINDALQELTERHYLDDARAIERYINMTVDKGYGPNYIVQKLNQKGINSKTTQVAIENADIDWQLQVKLAWQKKFAKPPANYHEKAKHYRFLSSRGFYTEHIASFLENL